MKTCYATFPLFSPKHAYNLARLYEHAERVSLFILFIYDPYLIPQPIESVVDTVTWQNARTFRIAMTYLTTTQHIWMRVLILATDVSARLHAVGDSGSGARITGLPPAAKIYLIFSTNMLAPALPISGRGSVFAPRWR